MTASVAIRVNDLGKEYHIGSEKQFNRLGDQVLHTVSAPFRRAAKLLRGQAGGAAELDSSFWALQDLNFEIREGEVVGIIGRNGAGKSTLLKILSQITDPTRGYAEIYGRVGSLLEVGTGFHPELTGRENVFLNGAILGMKKHEIERKFDEIVDFAGIEKFLDTPVKHYSSGMYVRLAFSVAAHLEPEVLLVDEVLAVGDSEFQRKCLGKMDDVAQQGRTVLFVSHNMGLMQQLCQRGIFLKSGQVQVDGSITDAVDAYLKSLEEARTQDLRDRTDRNGEGGTRLIEVEAGGGTIANPLPLKTGGPAHFRFRVDRPLANLACNFFIYDHVGQAITSFKSRIPGPADTVNPDARTEFVCDVDQLLLLPGRYRMDVVVLGENRMQDHVQAATVIDVGEGAIDGRPMPADKRFRIVMPHRWTVPERM